MKTVARRLARLVLPLLFASLVFAGTPASAAKVRDSASPTILLTGSNRGVGLALTKEFAGQGWNVIATCRTPKKAAELKVLAAANPKIIIEQLDVTDVRQIQKLAARYKGVPIDVLFHNAAWLGTPIEDQQFGRFDQELFTAVMNTNVYGPLKLSEALVANVEASTQKKIVGMTSGLGSLTLMGRMSRFYYYQMSKAAMNMGMRALRNDLQGRGITVALLAPGMVETDMLEDSGYSGKALKPAESAAGLYKLVADLTPQDKGVPVNVDGKVIPW
jgi:NAD(P)-dependent dehydrogenase (short-subunit alcohol dehydrogenase family)